MSSGVLTQGDLSKMRKNIKISAASTILLLLVMCFALMACSDVPPSTQRVSEQTQEEVVRSAMAAVPAYRIQEYTAREDVNVYLQETEGRNTWYVYALNFNGDALFYIVSDIKPRNICVSLTAPDRKVHGTNGNIVMTAPALDGVYYSGNSCDAYYMRDKTTKNFIELAGSTFTLVTSKAPLPIYADAELLKPAAE